MSFARSIAAYSYLEGYHGGMGIDLRMLRRPERPLSW
jgi:hypothetical protein